MKSKEDFLSDPEFIMWVKSPNPDLETYWDNWIKANPKNLEEIKLAKEILLAVKYDELPVPELKKQQILSRILEETQVREKKSIEKKHIKFPSITPVWVWRMALVILLIVGMSWLKQGIGDLKTSRPIVEGGLLSKSTKVGEKLQFSLEDGTRVWLNSSTELIFPKSFDEGERLVVLKGEAYFEVKQDSNRPFLVHSGDLITSVLGTAFNISTKDHTTVRIALLEGSISIKSDLIKDPVILHPGEMLEYDEVNKVQSKGLFDLKDVSAWRSGLIIFKNAPLNEVVKKLEDWYGVQIEVSKMKEENWRVNAEYQNETLENVLISLSYIHKFQFEINGKNVKLKL